jgi:hypothetical protein
MRLVPLFIVAVVFGPHAGYAQTLSCPEGRTIVELSGVGDPAEIARRCDLSQLTRPEPVGSTTPVHRRAT